jgi:hypothetical protein
MSVGLFGMSRGVWFLVFGILVLGLAVGFFWLDEEIEEEASTNESEVECVKIRTSCCPCNMGGKEACVLASEVEEYEEKLSECSEGLICAAVYNCEIESCGYVEGECVAV